MPPPDNRPKVAPAPIDFAHLAEQTAGDGALAAELLELFARQARTILERVEAAGQVSSGDRLILLHTLCGAARAIGAWEVATEAQRLEEDARAGRPPTSPDALRSSVTRACAVIAAA